MGDDVWDAPAHAYAYGGARCPTSTAAVVSAEAWRLAERRAAQILRLVRPTAESNRKRMRVIQFVQNLIGSSIGTHVVAFGSVPLKTFLPDGDVDLTALIDSVVGDTLVDDVRHILESEESNVDAELEVKDVRFIEAEVRLVKCLIENVIVDVSFNQIGGLCTLCFLELVDDYIGKDHLFKRSIILIKSWCYYESRILGAHHGLFSTYALETLVLYIFNLFHRSLVGPLSVLYKFLEYYSKFDWEKYCISLYGPVRLSSLPNSDVEMIDTDCDELLFTPQLVTNLLTSFCFPPQEPCSSNKEFTTKHLNIIDPLKENNNLGRSVSRSSYYRIKSAFSYGARKLSHILATSSPYTIPDSIALFFANTLQRNNITRLPDIETLTNNNKDIPELNTTNNENENASDMNGSESVSGVLDLTGNLEVHLTSLRRINLHVEDIFVQLQNHNLSTEEETLNPPTLSKWEANGLIISDPSPVTSSSPISNLISNSCNNTTEDQNQSQYIMHGNNNCMWNVNNGGGVIQEMLSGLVPAYDPYYNNLGIPYHHGMQYGIEETMWKQTHEWEMKYQEGIYMNAGVNVNGHMLSPRVGLDNNVSMQWGTGTFFPSTNGTNIQRDRYGGNGRPRKHPSAYHFQRQNRNNNNNNNNNSTNSWYWGSNIKPNEKNLSWRGNQYNNNPSYSRVDSTDTTNKANSEQTPDSHSINLEKSVEFGSLGPVILENNSSEEVCKSYEEEKLFELSDTSIQISACLEMNGSLPEKVMNLPLMEVPSLCSKENNVKVPLAAPHACKENVMLDGKKAWSCINIENDGKVLSDLHHRSWAEVSKRGALPYYLKDDMEFPPLAS